jgi:hypothetical protein
VNDDGTFERTVLGVPVATGIVTNPANGHLFISLEINPGQILDFDPVHNTSSVFKNNLGNVDGLSTDGDILYVADGVRIEGWRISDGAEVFNSGVILGVPDGSALGLGGSLAGNVFANDHDGTVVEVSLTNPNLQTVIATGGSRGDFATVDPSTCSLLLTQTDRIERLSAPPGSCFAPPPQPIQGGETATIGFWHNQNGQALISSFNGGPSSTYLANWLATTFPNLYGAGAGANNLTGQTNAQVAAFYETLFEEHGPKLDAQVLATALNVYATTTSLGGQAGAQYGFTVTVAGLGGSTFNVGSSGAAFGVPDDTTLTVSQILKAANQQAVNGVLYNGDLTLRDLAISVFDGINQAGDID